MINNPSLSVKSDGPVYSDGTGELNIGLVRSDVSGSAVPSFTGEALNAVMQRDGNSLTADPIEFTSYQYFQNSTDKVHYASWSPQGDYDETNGKVSFGIDGSTDILYGTPVSGTKETGFSPITFNHALVKFKVWVYAMVPVNEQTGAELYDPDERWGKVSQISVNNVATDYTIVLPKDGATYTFESGAARSAESPFTVTAESLEKFPRSFDTRKAVAEFMIPKSNTLTLNVKTSKLQTAQTISISKNFKQGYHYDIILRFTDHGLVNSEVIAGQWIQSQDNKVLNDLEGSVFFDLSQNETANCYMVSSANYNYCFDARIKGNGVNGVVDGTDVNLNPSYVKVLWQDASVTPASDGDPGFKLLSNKIASGMVLFTVKGSGTASDHSLQSEGNVLLGVYDEDPETNPQAKPLWTWHIWICDRPQVQGYKNGFTVQDRDLGAVASNPFDTGVNATDLDGLYYQWGRPTPLPLGRIENVVSLGQSSPYVSLNERISTPLVYFPQKLDENQENLKSLWGWRSASDEYRKTIYDPCPPGYRVPSRRLWNEMKIEHAHIKGTQGNVKNNHSIHIELDNHYDIFYPVSGYYDDSMTQKGYYNGTQQTGGAYMWAATYDDVLENPYSLLFDLDDAKTNNEGELETEFYSVTSNTIHSYYALPVRCISRRSTPHVEDLSAFQTANSYIVPSEGYYKFKANVRGNGVGRLVSPGSSEFIDVTEGLSTNMSDIVKVDYFWWQEAGGAAANPVTVPVILDNQGKVDDDGYAMFHIDSYKEGNLIIAGYDVDGNILWTWHLWLTDEPKQMKSHNFAVMDRFLGATFAPADDASTVSDNEFNESIGFFYQWGRKDPFAVNSWYGYSGGSWSVGTYVETNVSAEKTVPNSVRNPLRFHLGSGTLPDNSSFPTTNYSNFDSYNIIDNQCIATYRSDTGVETVRPALWGYSSASGLGKTTTKTMYDPCPPGYCVAFYTVWTSDDGGSYYTWLDGGYHNYGSRGNSVEKVNGKGIFVTANTFDKTWYPFTGYLSGKDMCWYGSGSQGRFNSSTPVGMGSRSMYYDANGAGQAANGSSSGVPSSYALPVRCQKQ